MISRLDKLDDHKLQSLANYDQGDLWALVNEVVSDALELLEDEIRTSPKFSDEDLTEDLRYKMGGVDCLKWVLELPGEARNLIK